MVSVDTNVYIYIHIYIYIYTHMNMNVYVFMFTCRYVCVDSSNMKASCNAFFVYKYFSGCFSFVCLLLDLRMYVYLLMYNRKRVRE